MLKKVIAIVLLSFPVISLAQETVELKNVYAPAITEKYHVFKSNNNVKNGLYQSFYKKVLIASGMYTQGKKTGMWHFYNIKGKLVQHYNYDKKQLVYIADEDSTHNIVKFEFIPKPAGTDSVSLPIRPGGLLYGYLPYVTKFKVKDAGMYNPGSVYAVLEILVSPYGRLAECKLLVKTKLLSISPEKPVEVNEKIADSYILNNDLLKDDEKEFVPATVNHQNVSSTIYIYCNVKANGLLSIY